MNYALIVIALLCAVPVAAQTEEGSPDALPTSPAELHEAKLQRSLTYPAHCEEYIARGGPLAGVVVGPVLSLSGIGMAVFGSGEKADGALTGGRQSAHCGRNRDGGGGPDRGVGQRRPPQGSKTKLDGDKRWQAVPRTDEGPRRRRSLLVHRHLDHLHWRHRSVSAARWRRADLLDDVQAIDDLAEDRVLRWAR